MAQSRFGGVSPTHAYQSRVKMLVAALVAVIVVLGLAVVFVAKNSKLTPVVNVPGEAVASTDADGSSILVTARRLEVGEQFAESMVLPRPWNPDDMPEGAIRLSDIESIKGMYIKDFLVAKVPLTRENLTATKPFSAIDIPPGYRAVTIEVDSVTGIEGYVRPNTRVDVLWTFVDGKQKKVKTLVQFTKVLSVGGLTQLEGQKANIEGKTTVSLLVTKRDAKKIELARQEGTLSLSLVGDDGVGEGTSVDGKDETTINIADIKNDPSIKVDAGPTPPDGVMYVEENGRQVKYELRGGRWSRAKD